MNFGQGPLPSSVSLCRHYTIHTINDSRPSLPCFCTITNHSGIGGSFDKGWLSKRVGGNLVTKCKSTWGEGYAHRLLDLSQDTFRVDPTALSKNRVWTCSMVKLGRDYWHVVMPIRLLREVNYV